MLRGTPNIPTNIVVPKFIPMYNPKFAPIKFIIYIIIAPRQEFAISFKILFNGNINILPNINKNIIQAKKLIIALMSKTKHHLY